MAGDGLLAEALYSYILPGRVADPRVGLLQAQAAQALGLGGVFLSERWETKELGAMMGALAQATDGIELIAGLTHFGTRHPLVVAGMGQTLQMLSGNRFVLGFGRGVPAQFAALGIACFNNRGMADHVSILRALWRGEVVSYDGPAGTYPAMRLPVGCEAPPPVILGAIGPRTLALAGAHFDGVVLHPFLTPDGVSRSVAIVREAAAAAGRDPGEVVIYATVVTAFDGLSDEQRADILHARAVSYFMHHDIGRALVLANGWDMAALEPLRATDLARLEYASSGSVEDTRRQLADAVDLLPAEWIAAGAATGSIGQCSTRLEDYRVAGADRILLHGTTPDQQADLIAGIKDKQ